MAGQPAKRIPNRLKIDLELSPNNLPIDKSNVLSNQTITEGSDRSIGLLVSTAATVIPPIAAKIIEQSVANGVKNIVANQFKSPQQLPNPEPTPQFIEPIRPAPIATTESEVTSPSLPNQPSHKAHESKASVDSYISIDIDSLG